MRRNNGLLIIITGPVGAGKSTTSLALAQSIRRPEREVAVIDLDQLYGFVRQQDGYGEVAAWLRARQGAAALANYLFTNGMAVVIIDGEFFTAEELTTLTASIPATVARRFFTLQVSYARVLEQVQGDPSRGASKNPAFLKSLHDWFVQALPFLTGASTVIDTEGLALDAVVARIAAELSPVLH